jgi:hypothetical protein
LHLRDIFIESFKIHEIGSTITNGQGIARLNTLAYNNPGRYHMITLAHLENFPSFINRTNSFFDYYRYKFFYDNVIIERENTQTAPVDLSTRYSDVSDISIKLTDDEENPIPQPKDLDPSFRTLKYSIFLDEEWKTIGEAETDEYGIATIYIIPWLEPGKYPLRVNFTGDSYYNECSSIFDLIVQKENTELVFSKVFSINNTDLITLKTRFSDDENNTIPQSEDIIKDNRSVSFYISVNGEWELIGSSKVDLNGSVELETSFLLPLGFYTLKAEFLEDSFYLGTETSGIIEINRESTLIGDFPSLEVQTTDTVLFSAELTDNELEPISGKEISFEAFISSSWTKLTSVITEEDGIGATYWKASLTPGIYVIRAKFYEDDYFKGFEEYSSAEILKEDTKLELFGKVSQDQGKYDLFTRLLEDDLTPTPITGEEIEIWVDGSKFIRTTDTNGYATVSISIADFGDITASAEYSGSNNFISSNNAYTKTFDDEITFFAEYSEDQMVDLFNSYSSHPQAGKSFFNYKEDILDGSLSDTAHLQDFINILGLPYTVAKTGQSSFEFRDLAYFLDPVSGGDGIVKLIFRGMEKWFSFQPQQGRTVNIGQEFTFKHNFTWKVIEDVMGWIMETISLDDLLNDLNLDDFTDLLNFLVDIGKEISGAVLSFNHNDTPYKVDIDFINIDLSDLLNILNLVNWGELVDWFIGLVEGVNQFWTEGLIYQLRAFKDLWGVWQFDWLKKSVFDGAMKGIWTVIDTIIHIFWEIVTKTVEITTDLFPNHILPLWYKHVGDLFWHYIGDTLYLAFQYWTERFTDLTESKFAMLSRAGITAWELLDSISQNTKEERLESSIIELNENREETKNHFINEITTMHNDILEGIQSFANLVGLLPFDGIIGILNLFNTLDPNYINPENGISGNELFYEITQRLNIIKENTEPIIFTELYEELSLKFETAIDLMINQIDQSNTPFNPDIETAENLKNSLIPDWNKIEDLKFSPLLSLDQLDIFQLLPYLESFDLIMITMIFVELPFIGDIAEWLIKGPFNSIFLNEDLNNFQCWLIAALLLMIFTVVHDFVDANESNGWSYYDELLIMLVGFLTFQFSRAASKSEVPTSYDQRVAEYFIGAGRMIFAQAVYEAGSELLENYVAGIVTDELSDNYMVFIDLIFTIYLGRETYESFEGEGLFYQRLWLTFDLIYGIPQSILPWIIKIPKATGIAVGLEIIAFLFFRSQIVL